MPWSQIPTFMVSSGSNLFVNDICFTITFCSFFFNDTATTEIYTLSLHDALPIYEHEQKQMRVEVLRADVQREAEQRHEDRKSTRLNSSHSSISYAVFCLKKKKNKHEL